MTTPNPKFSSLNECRRLSKRQYITNENNAEITQNAWNFGEISVVKSTPSFNSSTVDNKPNESADFET